MQRAAFIFPNQLFDNHPVLSFTRDVFVIEDRRFFRDFRFHKQKLTFHRASMQAYREKLSKAGCRVHYVACDDAAAAGPLAKLLTKCHLKDVFVVDFCDRKLAARLQQLCNRDGTKLHLLESPAFISPASLLEHFFRPKKHFSMARFYTAQRKALGILVRNGRPVGGKWSFDVENRRRLPANLLIPPLPTARPCKHLEQARKSILGEFKKNPGSPDNFICPVTHTGARRWLQSFLKDRLEFFGPYEDAISVRSAFVFHSALSPLLNTGLLTPKQVIEQTLAHAEKRKIPLNSLEGFVRQIVGWREFVRGVYLAVGEKQRRSNFWNCKNELPKAFYDATTGIEPVDTVIRRVLENAYCHHIERLMILGNFMLLCEIHPDEVYRWFMELFIDAYDWVMVPNVYGMSQYADGGLITTKPYISSSNYIRKMSNFRKGPWCEIWDGLFWRFVHKHQAVFACNPRMRMIAMQRARMDKSRLKKLNSTAENFMTKLLG